MENTEFVTRITAPGRIRGRKLPDAEIYRGIPYARTERFALPVPIRKWEGELDATGEPTDCWQYSSFHEGNDPDAFYTREFHSETPLKWAESPMTLNIICPPDAKGCPVLVFFHGGGFETGTVEGVPYGTCTEYARRGIVLVSVGYRLNVFSLYRGKNLGLHDQMTAVEWVRDFITGFGGDPERIVLMGQSAGAMSVTDLCYSRRLKGIVKGAVLLSGGGAVPRIVRPWTPEKSASFWNAVRERAGAKTEEELKEVPPERLWQAWFDLYPSKNFHLRQPGIDGEIIPDVPQKVIRRGEDLDIPVLIGVTAQDFLPVVLYEMALSMGKRNARLGRSPVYGYLFRRTPPGNCYKAFHAVDLWYMFGGMEQSWRPFTPEDRALSARMIDYTSAFVRTGNPNAEGLPLWPAITGKRRDFLCLDTEGEALLSPRKCRRIMLHTFLRDPGPM